MALDLKEPDGQEVLGRLLERADGLFEGFRPGTLARLGFPSDLLREQFPRLVVCSVTGWGQSGPYAARAGHDLTYQAVAGSLAPTAAMPSVPVRTSWRLERHLRHPRRVAGAAADAGSTSWGSKQEERGIGRRFSWKRLLRRALS